MSTTIRSIKIHGRRRQTNKGEETLGHLLKDQRKRARFILLSTGIVLISAGLFLSWSQSSTTSTNQPVVSESPTIETFSSEPVKIEESLLRPTDKEKQSFKPPVRIVVSDLSIDLPVKEAKVVSGYWEVFPDVAGFGLGSSYPGEVGNQVIFAHARAGLFFPLKNAKVGQKVIVFTQDKWYSYAITDIKEVNPNQIEVIAPTTDVTLTLYTCSGFADSKRLIVTAKPTS